MRVLLDWLQRNAVYIMERRRILRQKTSLETVAALIGLSFGAAARSVAKGDAGLDVRGDGTPPLWDRTRHGGWIDRFGLRLDMQHRPWSDGSLPGVVAGVGSNAHAVFRGPEQPTPRAA